MRVNIDVYTPRPITGARLYMTAVNRLGRWCMQSWLFDADSPILRTAGSHKFTCELPHVRLAPGQYAIRVLLMDRTHGRVDLVERCCPFEIVMTGQSREGGWPVNDIAYFEDARWERDDLIEGAETPSEVVVGET
jgi:lipopolysaccharide transport system ATP-binding protein